MPSIHTNAAALSALQTLRSVSSGMARTQNEISSGLRIETASDNAAYWSISTTMRSDNKAVAAVHDSLGLGSAMVDVAYSGLSATLDVLDDFKSKLVAASEPGVDRGKIQKELEQMKQQVHSIAESSSFNSVNWLNTDVDDIYATETNKVSLVSAFNRDSGGGVSLGTTDLQLSAMALFNENGGGLLQADPRFLDTIGGMRFWTWYVNDDPYLSDYNLWSGGRPGTTFKFSGPLTFGASDKISFDVTFDADNPEDGIPPPYNPGETQTVTIDRDLVDTVLPSNGGVIKTWQEYISVLNGALQEANAYSDVHFYASSHWVTYPTHWEWDVDDIHFSTTESSGLDGSSIAIDNFTSTVGSGGLGNLPTDYGYRGSDMLLNFRPFTVFKEVVVDFDFGINGEARQHYVFDRDAVNEALDVTDGRVGSAEDMAKLLNALIDRPEIVIEATENGKVLVKSDELTDRLSGSKSRIDFTNIVVNVEPLPMLNFDNIDVERAPTLLPEYIVYLDTAMERIIDGAAVLGSVQTRLEMQTEFTAGLMETIDTGVGRLVDANMEESSTRLKALEAQSQLSIQTLSIANSEPQAILQLFQ